MIDGGIPTFADRCGLGERYRYWVGHSGRRYLFTAVPVSDLSGFPDAVVIMACRDGRGFVGVDVMDSGREAAMSGAGQMAFVHLLTTTRAARAALMQDLTGSPVQLAA